ncbi:chorismate mutase [Granulicatella seriolae]|uniref:Chorismate mutase n=1 Tax=Granulicatella seriolae TaxID=2967226 RepID=A0ABT1WP71_9LACT|nr:chorismate mutase [Granulicatella seriolae]
MLEEERKQIDAIDAQLIPLLEKRWDLIIQVANQKRAHNIPVFDARREQAILEKVAEKVSNPDYKESLQDLYSHLFDLSRAYQTKLLDQD